MGWVYNPLLLEGPGNEVSCIAVSRAAQALQDDPIVSLLRELQGMSGGGGLHTQERPFKCEVAGCEYAAAQSNDLLRHMRTHTGERPFACGVPGCGYAAAQGAHLTCHMRTHTGERPYACGVPGCSYASAQSGALLVHMRSGSHL